MKQLNKVKIINWHYFWNETIDIRPIVFLTGVNGSGKSTLIDAIQLVLLGDTTGKYFNKAAMDKSSRTLVGYLRGELGDTVDGGFKYLRNGRFTSYVALEYFDTLHNSYFTMGVVFDVFSEGTIEHKFFFLDNKIPENEFVVNNVPMDIKTLGKYCEENYPLQFQFFDSNRQYQDFMKKKFGGLKDKYFSLLKKATSFSPITDIATFITEYVCDPQANIELDALQDNILQYKRLENEALNIEKRVKRLEEVNDIYATYKKHKENLTIAQYILERCQLEQSYDKLRKFNKQIESNKKRIAEIDEELLEFQNNLSELEDRKNRLIMDKASNDTVRISEDLKRQRKDVKDKISAIQNNISTVKTSLYGYANNFANCGDALIQNLEKLNIDILGEDRAEEIEEIKEASKDIKQVTASFKQNYLSNIIELDKGALNDFRDALMLYKNKISSLAVSLARTIQNLEKSIRGIREQENEMKSGSKAYDSRLVMVKARLEQELQIQFGHKIEVAIYADLVDIDDLSWSNAIEGFLSGQKFNLFVAPKYYASTYKILRRLLDEYKFYGTALVDEEKIIERGFVAESGSLAEEIITDHEGAKAYTNFLIGRLHKSKNIEEARESGNGITKECDLYRNYSLAKINPRLYHESFIGRGINERFLKEKSKQISEYSENLNYFRKIKAVIDEANSLEVFTKSEIDNYFVLLAHVADLAGYEANLAYINKELQGSDTPLSESIDNRIRDIEQDIKDIHESRDRIVLEKGNLTADIETIKSEKIIAEQQAIKEKEDSINSSYDPFLVDEIALPAYQAKLAEGKTVFEIYQDTNVEYARLTYLVNNIRNQVIKLRRDYLQDYHLSYDAEADDNKAFDDELVEFRDVKLPEYREKIQDSYNKATKQFKDDFIFKLRGAIEDVEDQIDNLNVALRQSAFGKDLYRFTVKPSTVYKRYYDMLKDDLILETGKDDSAFVEKYKDVMEELFRQIVDVGEGEKNALLLENVAKFTDYRSYLEFDLIVYNKETGDEQRLSKMIKKKSGGETQTPFYIAVLASFAQLYHTNDEGEMGNTTRLIIFDEAFSKMDKTRMTQAVKLLNDFKLQVILSAPYDKIPDISPLVDETLIVLRDKNRSTVRLFEKE
ncbi:MAG: AAA family ATPase [Bacilli bacterium]|nr:AAA family ATPase [Bacilli bacterium]